MDKDTKAAFAKLTKAMQDGFASLETRMEARMETGFAAVAEDLSDIKDRLAGVESKIAGTNRRLDTEAMYRDDLKLPKRVADIEEKVFGASRHPADVPLT